MAPEPRSRMWGTTAWVSHSAAPAFTSIMSRSSSGVAESASPVTNAPIVFTSTSGADRVPDGDAPDPRVPAGRAADHRPRRTRMIGHITGMVRDSYLRIC